MATLDSPRIQALLTGKHIAVLSTLDPDGKPRQSPLWFLYEDGKFLLITERNFVKARNMRRDPRVSLCIQDERPPYASITVIGVVALGDPPPDMHVRMAQHYLGEAGAAVYFRTLAARPQDGGGDVLAVLTPARVIVQDFAEDVAAAS